MKPWWLVVDPSAFGSAVPENPADPSWFLEQTGVIRLDSLAVTVERPVLAGDELWLWDRPAKRVFGLAHAVSDARKGKIWRFKAEIDHEASALLTAEPVLADDHVLPSRPAPNGDPRKTEGRWLWNVWPGDHAKLVKHLERLRHELVA
jgi:hypothetical protein